MFFASKEAGKDSDVDLMVDFDGPVGMEVVDLVFDLERILGRRVDLVTYRGIRERLFPLIENELQFV